MRSFRGVVWRGFRGSRGVQVGGEGGWFGGEREQGGVHGMDQEWGGGMSGVRTGVIGEGKGSEGEKDGGGGMCVVAS